MPFNKLAFTKNWNDPDDFPTFEDDEAQVRRDMQYLFDEIRDFINSLIDSLRARSLPFDRTPEIDSSTVQNAIENVQAQLASVTVGQLPDGSVSMEKLAPASVSEVKIVPGAVSSGRLADAAVTAEKLAAGAVTSEKLAPAAVTGDKIADGTVGAEKLEARALENKADLDSGKLRASQRSLPSKTVRESAALGVEDAGKVLFCANSAALTLTIPANSDAEMPIGSEIEVFRAGAGEVNIASDPAVTLLTAGARACITRQYQRITLKKWTANTWSLEGAGAAMCGEDNLAADCVGTEKLADGAVTQEKIAVSAVTADKLAPGAADNAALADGAVTAAKLAAGAVGFDKCSFTSGYAVLGADMYGTALPAAGHRGRIFFKKL